MVAEDVESVNFDWLHLSEEEGEEEYDVYDHEVSDADIYRIPSQTTAKSTKILQTTANQDPDRNLSKVPNRGCDRNDYNGQVDESGQRYAIEITDNDELVARGIAPRYYDALSVCPSTRLLLENFEAILGEVRTVVERQRDAAKAQPIWTPWPEETLYSGTQQAGDWKVIPLVYTFPANDPSSSKWVQSNCDLFPVTTGLLRQIPEVRTALFSRLGGCTRLSAHQGWADLANYVLRCHLPLIVPEEKDNLCGMWVEGHVNYHKPKQIIMFDDSKWHKAFNATDEDRIVLIFDIMRPKAIPLGRATGGHTEKLDQFIEAFQALST